MDRHDELLLACRSGEFGQHNLRVRQFTRILLEETARRCPEYALTEQTISLIAEASVLHDIGKISIPEAILNKPDKLTAEEAAIMRTHTTIGCNILDSMQNTENGDFLRYAWDICHDHHERWDGGGYPEGLAGDAIPIWAQIVGLADAYDALTSKRHYKEAIPADSAAEMILEGACGVFSPALLECFKSVRPQLEVLTADAHGVSTGTGS